MVAVTPRPGTASTIATGGTAQQAVAPSVNGGYITNPASATDQGLSPAENLYVDPVGNAGTQGNGTTSALAPGESYQLIPNSTVQVTVNAATTGHKFVVVVY